MAKLTFSNASNAVRGFKTMYPELALNNETIRAELLDRNSDGSYSINLEVLAEIQQERLGVVTYNRLEGVPMLRRSVSRGVVSKTRAFYATLPAGTARKDAIAAAVSQGIAFYTARTQYQRFTKQREA
jgi:hypothetical protein